MTKKKPLKTEYYNSHWLKLENLTQKEYEKRQKKREAMEKKHPRLKVKAHGASWDYCGGVFDLDIILKDPQLFIDVSEADQKQKKALAKWLTGQTCPKIPGVEFACYPVDYSRFREAFIDGKVAPIND